MALIKGNRLLERFLYADDSFLKQKYDNADTLGIYRYVGQFTRYMSETMAAVIITLIPIL